MAVLRMPFFNRSRDGRQLIARLARPEDGPALRALARHAQWSYLTGSSDDVAYLARHDPTVVLFQADRMIAAAQVGWRLPPNSWLRAVLIDGRVDVSSALDRMLPVLHRALPAHGITASFITLDEWSSPWLRSPLEASGYRWIMDVWGYAKRRFDVPSTGNQAITLRRAERHDLPQVLEVDRACFPTPWAKGAEILEPAITSAPHVVVAEVDEQLIGYSFVSLHGGWHAHLVRIAVAPAFQGSGVGVRLLADVVRFCRHRRIELLTLNTQATNVHAQRLYEWFGFERTTL